MSSNAFEEKYQQEGFDSQRKYPNEALIRFLNGSFGDVPKADRHQLHILEIGSGSGANLWMIAKEGFQAVGIDSSPTGIELSHAMMDAWNVTADLHVGEMQHLPFPDSSFDAVVDAVSMQHVNLADHRTCYREAYRCLKPSGIFFQYHLGSRSSSFHIGGGTLIDECTVDNVKNQSAPLWGNGVTCFLKTDTAYGMLREAGFLSVATERYERSYVNDLVVEYLSIVAKKTNVIHDRYVS